MTENKSSDEADPRKKYGMKLKDLTNDILNDIVTIYDKVVGSRVATEFVKDTAREKMGYIHKILKHSNAAEWRFGSKLSIDSKLYIWEEWGRDDDSVIRFSFDPNFTKGNPGKDEKEEAGRLVESFRTEVEDYLIDRNLAVEL